MEGDTLLSELQSLARELTVWILALILALTGENNQGIHKNLSLK